MRFGARRTGSMPVADYEVVRWWKTPSTTLRRGQLRRVFPCVSLLQPEWNEKGGLSMDNFVTGIVLRVGGGASNLEPVLRKTIGEVDANLGVIEVVELRPDELGLRCSSTGSG